MHDAPTVQRRTIGVLSGAQVLGGLGIGVGVAAGGLIAAEVAGTDSVAGLAATTVVLGAAASAIPLASLTSDHGRRIGLSFGLVVGALGSALVVLGAALAWLPVVLLGTLMTGSAMASSLQARYAATDLATPDRAASALSLVVWATTVGAVLGPNLTAPGAAIGDALGVPGLAGAYVISAVALTLAALLVWTSLRPDPLLLARAHDPAAQPRVSGARFRERTRDAWAVVRASTDARLGLAAVAVGQAAMLGVMVMTPVHLAHAEVSITVIGVVISVHILGMYAFSPVVGWVSDRAGRHAVITTGAVLLTSAAAVAGFAAPGSTTTMSAGLFLLGLGWSCCLVAGSALLSESVPASSRQDAQGLSDLSMNACGALAGAVAGGVVAVLSFSWLALLAGVIVVPLALGAARGRQRARRPA